MGHPHEPFPEVPPGEVPEVSDKGLEKSRAKYSGLSMNVHLRQLHDFGANMVKAGQAFGKDAVPEIKQQSSLTGKEGGLGALVNAVAASAGEFGELSAFARALADNCGDLEKFVMATEKGLKSYGHAALDAVGRYDSTDMATRRDFDKIDLKALRKGMGGPHSNVEREDD